MNLHCSILKCLFLKIDFAVIIEVQFGEVCIITWAHYMAEAKHQNYAKSSL